MFTGIIEEIGSIEQIQKGVQSAVLSIQCKKVLEGTKIGDSIAVNGVCLTVTSMHVNGYTADVMAETLERSSLAGLKKGSRVNLERAMPADGRFGGHIVAGHIDGTGIVEEITKDETAVWYRISAGEELLRYIVEKGSIAIDGISLTVSIIPHTQGETTLSERKVSDVVNLECDIIGKYVERLCGAKKEEFKKSTMTREFLLENGF